MERSVTEDGPPKPGGPLGGAREGDEARGGGARGVCIGQKACALK